MVLHHGLNIRDTENAAQFIVGHFHGTGCLRGAGRRLWKRGRHSGVECDVAFHLLHYLVDVAIENGYRAEAFEMAERLRTVRGGPTPFGVDRPEWDMRKDDNGTAG